MENRNEVAIKSTQAVTLEQIERMAIHFAKSGLFGIRTPEQGIALMLIAQAEGLHPAVAARDYHVIQGRPALKSDAMLARFQQAGGKVVWNVYSDAEVSGTFSHPAGGATTVSWTIAQAKAAGLTGKDVWKQYPRAMLRARCISEGIRTVYPGVSVGVYTPEEIDDFDAKPPVKEVKAETVQAKQVASVSVQQPAVASVQAAKPAVRIKFPLDPERKELFGRIKTIVEANKWGYADLSAYIRAAFDADDSASLTTDELKIVASVCEASTFDNAMKELEATSFDTFEKQVNE